MDCEYLFPFEKIPKNSRVVIYGAGELGQSYYKQLVSTGYCDVVGLVDKNYKQYRDTALKVNNPLDIKGMEFDFVVVAVKGKALLPEIYRVLDELDVARDKIVYVGIRKIESDQNYFGELTESIETTGKMNIALFLLCGIGGLIFIKRWLVELLKYAPDSNVHLYCGNHEEITRYFFSDIPNVKAVRNNLGNRYQLNKGNYALAMRVAGGGAVIIDNLNKEAFLDGYVVFFKKIEELKQKLDDEEFVMDVTPRIAWFEKCRFQKKNAYTSLGYGVFDFEDVHVSIPIVNAAVDKFKKLGLKKYITVNAGNGITSDSTKIAKTWPVEYFKKTIELFKESYPEFDVVQLGDAKSEKIDSADYYIFGEKFDFVSCLLKNAAFHLDIEGGLVHIATQLGTKCVVLFGPTPQFYYGYPSNINIRVGTCHECCGVYLDHNKCARNLSHPECMYGIKPQLVMSHIEKYLSGIQS